MTDEHIIDASQCEWRTGVEHCGDYECMLNKCCDFNCDWYKRRKLEQQLQAKEQECETLKDENFHLQNEGKKSCAYCADFIAKEQECEFSNLRIIQLQETLKQYEEENTELKNQRDQWISRCEQETKTKEFFEDRLKELGFKNKEENNDNQ